MHVLVKFFNAMNILRRLWLLFVLLLLFLPFMVLVKMVKLLPILLLRIRSLLQVRVFIMPCKYCKFNLGYHYREDNVGLFHDV